MMNLDHSTATTHKEYYNLTGS